MAVFSNLFWVKINYGVFMEGNMELIFLLVSLFASTIGAICGIGGGVITKPILDSLNHPSLQAAEVSFLSSISVFSMALFSVSSALRSKEKLIDVKVSLPMALGAAAGGLLGKILFHALLGAKNPQHVSLVQAAILVLMTVGTFFYALYQEKIPSFKVSHVVSCFLTGFGLGMVSSFLGIGGGPINIAVLGFLFSMNPKVGAQNSLYIILFSQFFSILYTILSHNTPDIQWTYPLIMIAGGLLGGVLGKRINKMLDVEGVRKLFLAANILVILLSVYNIVIRF